jgi:ABC-type spermidine/putrescine transport system permease subunit I
MYPRWLWPSFALPGVIWLVVLFLVPFYAVIGVAFGTVDPIFYNPIPAWNPINWNVGYVLEVARRFEPGAVLWDVSVRTTLYVVVSLALSLLIGYPVAYYIARHAHGKMKAVLLVLLIAPFWISYLMRMLAWVNLLAPDGYANRFLSASGVDRIATEINFHLTFAGHRVGIGPLYDPTSGWLDGQDTTVVLALVYGYIPYLILPLFAALDRLDTSLLEAARDLGANQVRAFFHVTLPLSKPGVLGGAVLIALPMFGDYYTPNLVSGSPRTSMLGNQIDDYFHGGPAPAIGAAITLFLSLFLMVAMAYYILTIHRASKELAR